MIRYLILSIAFLGLFSCDKNNEDCMESEIAISDSKCTPRLSDALYYKGELDFYCSIDSVLLEIREFNNSKLYFNSGSTSGVYFEDLMCFHKDCANENFINSPLESTNIIVPEDVISSAPDQFIAKVFHQQSELLNSFKFDSTNIVLFKR